ncbi:MAG: hypothetical protein WBG82_01660 [Parvibaculum sp.]|uniref:hypothetical protein n=1 Tax=Parvibaculum sp. TaxID=2024848 RepID=UPI003C7295A4
MKHATAAALDHLEPLLVSLRQIEGLSERSRGVFYRKGRAFLHFHEDPEGLFADMRAEGDFVRHRVSTVAEQKRFLAAVKKSL